MFNEKCKENIWKSEKCEQGIEIDMHAYLYLMSVRVRIEVLTGNMSGVVSMCIDNQYQLPLI